MKNIDIRKYLEFNIKTFIHQHSWNAAKGRVRGIFVVGMFKLEAERTEILRAKHSTYAVSKRTTE